MTGTAESIYSDGTYQEHNQSWHVEDSPWKAQQILRILQKNNVNPATVAEVGCGAGEILRQLSIELPDATFAGYEMSPQAIALCKSRELDRVSFQLQDLTQTDAAFDCLLCIDVFEHIEDYMGFTRKLGPKAKHVVFHIPLEMTVFGLLRGIMLHSRAHSGHIHYFSKETALATLKDCGFPCDRQLLHNTVLGLPRRKPEAADVQACLSGSVQGEPGLGRQAVWPVLPDGLGYCTLILQDTLTLA